MFHYGITPSYRFLDYIITHRCCYRHTAGTEGAVTDDGLDFYIQSKLKDL